MKTTKGQRKKLHEAWKRQKKAAEILRRSAAAECQYHPEISKLLLRCARNESV